MVCELSIKLVLKKVKNWGLTCPSDLIAHAICKMGR